MHSQKELKIQRDAAEAALAEAEAELRKAEALEERDHGKARPPLDTRAAAASA